MAGGFSESHPSCKLNYLNGEAFLHSLAEYGADPFETLGCFVYSILLHYRIKSSRVARSLSEWLSD